MKLESQLESLAHLGLKLNDGLTIDDLLYSFDREDFEERPFDLILFSFGSEVEREPWGKFCSHAWNLDMECVVEANEYESIVERLCEVANLTGSISNIESNIDFEAKTGWLKYTVDGRLKEYSIEIDNDWADPQVLAQIMGDIERNGCHFYGKDNGQATVWFYLDSSTANKLNDLSNNSLVQGP